MKRPLTLDAVDSFSAATTLMIQGCTSDAGKTVMVAGIGRVLARQGLKVAPFKPQNMALNSAVTEDGGEIGRAQALQAQACLLAPHTDFNPILLKPSSDTGAQVIVHGKAIDAMQAAQYHDYKKVAMTAVLDSYRRLTSQYEAIIVEGAGSPAEINLRDGDIANMGFAEAVDCPVVLVADIDRGGVFAHLIGTLELLSKPEQARVVGFIINRFRGDISLLQPGLDWLEHRTAKPVLGVVPYLTDFYLDAEDAISIQQVLDTAQTSDGDTLKVVVPVLPRISNHTDFDALRLHGGLDLQFVSIDQPCPPADLVILPGSKNVISDLRRLKRSGWAEGLARHLRYGGKLLGVCGGYQMLGRRVDDPMGVENDGAADQEAGFGLLDIDTKLAPSKQLRQVRGQLINVSDSPVSIRGYEIHCGNSVGDTCSILQLENGRHDGAISDDRQVMGCYLHGLFDDPSASTALLAWAGLESTHAIDLDALREQQLDRLADCLEANLDPVIWKIFSDHHHKMGSIA